MGKKRRGSGIEINSYPVYTVFHHIVQRRFQKPLIDIMLVLSYADTFSRDLYQLRQWILQPAS